MLGCSSGLALALAVTHHVTVSVTVSHVASAGPVIPVGVLLASLVSLFEDLEGSLDRLQAHINQQLINMRERTTDSSNIKNAHSHEHGAICTGP